MKLIDVLSEIIIEQFPGTASTLSPFEFDQDGNGDRIGRDIDNNRGWRRLPNNKEQSDSIKDYLDRYTTDYKWNSSVPTSDQWSDENNKMYKTPYLLYVHLLQTSDGINNVVEALKGMIDNEPIETNIPQLRALLMIYEDDEKDFNEVYDMYEDIINKNSTPDDGSNVFAAFKYAKDNFSDKKGIFKKFFRNGWGGLRFNLK